MTIYISFDEFNSTLQISRTYTKCTLNEEDSFLKIKFIQTQCIFHTDFGEFAPVKVYDTYEGPYVVTPRVYPQKLETKEKLMNDDVTIKIIPLAKVPNIKNGLTATIG